MSPAVPPHLRRARVTFSTVGTHGVTIHGLVVTYWDSMDATCDVCGEQFDGASLKRLRDHARDHAERGEAPDGPVQEKEEVPF